MIDKENTIERLVTFIIKNKGENEEDKMILDSPL